MSRGERGKRNVAMGKRQEPMAKKCCYDKILMISFLGEEKMRTKEGKRMVTVDFFFKTTLFGHIFNNSAHSFFNA
jgi:hypothetical protein